MAQERDLSELLQIDEERRRRAPARAAGETLFRARGQSPEAAALAERASTVLGVPPSLARDPAALAEAQAVRDREALAQAPRTATFMADPDNAAVAHDQVEGLSVFERAFQGFTNRTWDRDNLLNNWRSGWAQGVDDLREFAGGALSQQFGAGFRGLADFVEIQDRRNPLPIGELGGIRRWAVEGQANALRYLGRAFETVGNDLSGAPIPEQPAGVTYQRRFTERETPRGFGSDVVGALGQIGGQVAAGPLQLPLLFGSGVDQMSDRVDAAQERDGRATPSLADDAASVGSGLVTTILEKTGLDAILGRLPNAVQGRILNRAVDIAVAGGTEGVTEVLEGVGQNALAMTLLGEDTGLLDGNLAYEGSVGATAGAIARSVALMALPGRQYAADEQRAQGAQRDAQQFDQLVEQVVGNPLLERAPERLRHFLRGVAGDETVYVPAEKMAEFFQSNPDLEGWLDEWDVRDQYEAALATGADVAFNQADYLALVAPTDAHTAFREDLRFGLGAMSVREASDFEKNAAQSLDEAFGLAVTQAQEAEVAAAPEQRVREDVFGQLRAAGMTVDVARYQAELEVARAKTRAARSPEAYADAWAAYRAQPLTIQRAVPETVRANMDRTDVLLEALRQGRAAPSQRRMLGRSLMEFVAAEGGIVDTGGELAAMGADQWHRQQRFRRKIIRGDDDQGVNGSDYVAQRAIEAGYLPEGSTGNDLLEAFREELAGRPVFSRGFERDLAGEQNAQALDDLEQTLNLLGVDLTSETNAEIKARLEQLVSASPDGARVLEQMRQLAATDAAAATLDDLQPNRVESLLDKTGWVLLTAENPMGEQASAEENAAANARLVADLEAAGLKYQSVVGRYGGNPESSFFVVGVSSEQALELGRKYNQDSVLTREGFVYQDGSVRPARGVESYNERPDDYFTEVPETGAMFQVDIDWSDDAVIPPAQTGREFAQADGTDQAPLTSPPVNADGTITLHHYGPEGLTETDPNRWGASSMLPRSERQRIAYAPPRTYFGIGVGQPGGYKVEFGPSTPAYTAQVPAERLYDMAADPDGIRDTLDGVPQWNRVNEIERRVAEKYDGYWLKNPELGLVAVVFKPMPVTRVRDGELAQEGPGNPAFDRWFGDSKVVDENGQPLVVYHGTMGDFEAFDLSMASYGSNLGEGFYFSNNRDEVAANYAGQGPDATQRITMAAENIAGNTNREYDDPTAFEDARAELGIVNDGLTIPAYLSLQNPVVLGGNGETVFTFQEPYDPETEEYGEATGTLLPVVEALRGVIEAEYSGAEAVVLRVFEIAVDNEGISASELERVLDENGIMGADIGRVFRAAGYDGIIDNTVNTKFGTERRYGLPMAGMDAGTTHYIAFEPTQIKSVFNRGTYDPADPRILFQSETPAADTISKLKDTVPGIAGVAPYLTPEERGRLKKSSARKLVDFVKSLPTADEMASVAWSGRAKRGWYERSATALMEIFGAEDAVRFAALLAALSPQTSVESNTFNALATWVNWNDAGRPTDRRAIIAVMGRSVEGDKGEASILDAWINNSVRALGSDSPADLDLSGAKVNSFFANLVGVVDEVTNDAWMGAYAAIPASKLRGPETEDAVGRVERKGIGYIAMNVVARRAAEVLSQRTGQDWTPAEVQETVWSWAKTLYERRDSMDQTTEEILAAGGLRHEDIAGTVDFALLFTNGVFRRILEVGGYGDQVEALGARGEGGRGPDQQGDAASAEGSGVAEDVFAADLQAAARRLERVRSERLARAAERRGTSRPSDQLTLFQSDTASPPFYSALTEAVANTQTKSAPAAQWLATLRKTPGVKAEEIEWTGLEEWLTVLGENASRKGQDGSFPQLFMEWESSVDARGNISREAVLAFLQNGGVKVEEVVLGADPDSAEIAARAEELYATGNYDEYTEAVDAAEDEAGASPAQFSSYKLPGADDTYREILLTLPNIDGPSTHWDQPNVVAHARITTRTDASGAKVLFLEEVQSDWHQKGRDEGYQNERDPVEIEAAREALEAAREAREEVSRTFSLLVADRLVEASKAFERAGQNEVRAGIAQNLGDTLSMRVSMRHVERAVALRARPETQGNLANSTFNSSDFITGSDDALVAARAAWSEVSLREAEALQRSRNAERAGGIPNAPFQKSWSTLVMKRMIRYAVDNGFDKVAWINGNQQNGGQTGGDGSFFYERNLVNTTNDLLKKYGARVEQIDFRPEDPLAQVPFGVASREASSPYLDMAAERIARAEARGDMEGAQIIREEAEAERQRLLRPATALGIQNGFVINDKIKAAAERGFTLFQNNQGRRGSIQFSGDQQIVTLLATADKSTFLHEMGHRYLEALISDAQLPTASERVKADLAIIMGWMNVGSVNEIGVAQHEMWAETFERYLMEGRAPSVELRGAFQRFRAWLTSIYNSVRRSLPNAALNDDIRAVMDRLLATDDEIEAARSSTGLEQAFTDAQQAGMTREAFTAYAAAVERARADADDELLRRTMRAIRKERTAEWEALGAEIRPEIAEEVARQPDIAAMEFLRTNGSGLDRETVIAMLGDEAGIALLPKGVPPVVRATGLHPDTVAEAAGYPSGMALLNGLMDYQAERQDRKAKGDNRSMREARTEDRVRERLLENYGDPLTDGSIEEEALAAIHNDRQAEVLGIEMSVLGRRVNQTPSPLQILRSWAERHIGERPVTAAKPGRFLQAERKAANAAQRALAADDRAEAFRQKQAQTVNFLLYSEAKKAQKFVDGAISQMRKLGGKKTLRSMDQDYLDRIHEILRRYDLVDASLRNVRARKSLIDFVKEQEAAGNPINIPSKLIEQARKTHYTELTVDEVRELHETIQHLAGLGRLKQKLRDGQEERELAVVVEEAVKEASALPDKSYRQGFGPADSWLVRTGEFMANTEATLVKLQSVLRRLDGNKRGVWTRVLDEPGQLAANRLSNLRRTFWEPIIAAERAIPLKIKQRWTERLADHPLQNPRNGQPLADLVRRDLIGMARHTGTASNFEKFAKGWGLLSREADEFQVEAARRGFIGWLDTQLDPTEWDYVAAWWQAHEQQRDAYFDNERDLTGVRPIPVPPAPFVAGGKPRAGGYAPISYDPRFDNAAAIREAEDAQDMFGGFTRVPRTSNGAAQDRTGYVGPVNIGLERAGADAHTQMVRLAYGRYITDALRFLRQPAIRETVRIKQGDAIYAQLEAWLAAQVKDGAAPDAGADWWVRLSRGARTNFSAAVLLGSATVLIAQPAGLAAAAAAVGPVRLAKGIGHMASLVAQQKAQGFIFGKSDYMRLRVEEGGYDRDIRTALLRQPGFEGAKERAIQISAMMVGYVDFYMVSGPTWLAAYNQAIVDGMEDQAAVLAADAAVQRTQGGGRPIDMAGVQRNNELTKILTFAYGWANAHYNLQRDFALDLKAGRNGAAAASGLLFLVIAAPLADALLSGDWPDDDEDDPLLAWAGWFMRNVAFGLPVGLPGIRDWANAAENEMRGRYAGSIGQTPLGRIIDTGRQLADDAYAAGIDSALIAAGAEVEDREVSRRWPAHVINAVGFTLGVPGTITASRATNYLTDVADGEQNPDSVMDWVTGLLRGPQDDQK